jgi:hypothetical protein
MKKPSSTKIDVRIPIKQFAALCKLARKHKFGRSGVIREALDKHLEANNGH